MCASEKSIRNNLFSFSLRQKSELPQLYCWCWKVQPFAAHLKLVLWCTWNSKYFYNCYSFIFLTVLASSVFISLLSRVSYVSQLFAGFRANKKLKNWNSLNSIVKICSKITGVKGVKQRDHFLQSTNPPEGADYFSFFWPCSGWMWIFSLATCVIMVLPVCKTSFLKKINKNVIPSLICLLNSYFIIGIFIPSYLIGFCSHFIFWLDLVCVQGRLGKRIAPGGINKVAWIWIWILFRNRCLRIQFIWLCYKVISMYLGSLATSTVFSLLSSQSILCSVFLINVRSVCLNVSYIQLISIIFSWKD